MNLAQRLRDRGHEVTYITLRQWEPGGSPNLDGISIQTVGPRMHLYGRRGRRRSFPPLAFGLGVLIHLIRHGRHYDIVHTASFPYFPLLGAALVRRPCGFRLVVDWHEVWSRSYWQRYAGTLSGSLGWCIQRVCASVPQTAFCFSELHAKRLRVGREGRTTTVLRGEYDGPTSLTPVEPREPLVVYAGRHTTEKRVPSLVAAIAHARLSRPDLRAVIFGDGPERDLVLEAVADANLGDYVSVPGFVPPGELEDALARAACLVLPSEREGYGLVVVEAAARGTPSVVVRGPENGAVELVEAGINGCIADSNAAAAVGSAILDVLDKGLALRESTARWFIDNAHRLSMSTSLETVLQAYADRF